MDKTRLQNLPTGHDGEAYITLNGNVVEAFKIAKIGGKLEPVVEEKQLLGQRMTQHAVRGLKGTGDISYYNTTDAFIRAYRNYKNGGSVPEITAQYYSDPGTSEYDRIEVTVTGVILASVMMGALDDSSTDAQKMDSSFTFDDFDLI